MIFNNTLNSNGYLTVSVFCLHTTITLTREASVLGVLIYVKNNNDHNSVFCVHLFAKFCLWSISFISVSRSTVS